MREVQEAAAQGLWEQALVELASRADHVTLPRWERERQPHGFTQQVENLVFAFQDRSAPSAGEIEQNPLASLIALDRVAALERRALRAARSYRASTGTDWWLLRLGTTGRRRVPMARQSGLAHWLQHHAVAPVKVGDIRVQVHAAAGSLASALSELAAAAHAALDVWVGHFDDGSRVRWDSRATPSRRWLALDVHPPEPRRASSAAALRSATECGAHVLVLPELALDMAARQELALSLEAGAASQRPLLCVPGSFHEQIGGRWFNTAPLLDGITGETLFVHRKLRLFGTVGEGDEPDFAEAIEVGDEFNVLASDAGCFGVLICKDHLDAHPSVRTLIQQVPIDWLLVPSYGDEKTIEGQMRRARELAKTEVGCHVVVANIRNLGIGQGTSPLPGFGIGPHDDVPQRVEPAGGRVRFPFDTEPAASPAPARRPALKRIR
jgi:hypothetical protein